MKCLILAFLMSSVGASMLPASIVATTVPGVEQNFNGGDVLLDFDGDSVIDILLSSSTSGIFRVSVAAIPRFFPNSRIAWAGGDHAANLAPGSLVGSIVDNTDWEWNHPQAFNLTLASCAQNVGGEIVCFGEFQDQPTGYLGIEFEISGQLHYGWIEIDADGFGFANLHRYAYETIPGKSIEVGAIPEPSSTLLTLIAAFALSIFRQRGEAAIGIVRGRHMRTPYGAFNRPTCHAALRW